MRNAIAKLYDKQVQRNQIIGSLESVMANLRLAHEMKKLNPASIVDDNDPRYGEFAPEHYYEKLRSLDGMPSEARRALSLKVPEV